MSGKLLSPLIALLLWPGSVRAKPDAENDSLANGTVIVKHGRNRLVTLGRELDGGKIRSGSSKWDAFEVFQSHYARTGDSAFYRELPSGNYSVWVLDSAYRMAYESFNLGRNGTRYIDAQTGKVPVGKKGLAVIEDKASKAPLSGALAYFECSAPKQRKKAKLVLHQSAVTSDSLGRIEIPPCLNSGDTVYVLYPVTDYSKREAFVKMAPAMEEDSLWRIGAIRLDETLKPRYQEEGKSPVLLAALTYSLGFPLSDGKVLHAISQSVYFGFFGFDCGFEFPNGIGFVNIKGWFPFIPVLRGSWTVPLGTLGAGVGAYQSLDHKTGYQGQVWYSFLVAHINMKFRKDFEGHSESTLGIGASIPLYFPGKKYR